MALLDLFLELCALPSPPGQERAVADRVIGELDAVGLHWEEDGCGVEIGSTMGNIVCRLAGARPAGVPVFFCAHLDTVPLEGALEPVVVGGVVRNAGGTILGADNKAAVAVMLEAARRIVEQEVPHAGVELLFTPMEETGLFGALAFDVARLEARVGYVYDQAAPIGEIILGAPFSRGVLLRFLGRAAHAGMHPTDGRSAVLAANRTISALPHGQIDDRSTLNVGTIHGGVAGNIVPESCVVDVDVRSHDETRLDALLDEIRAAAEDGAGSEGCEVEVTVTPGYPGYRHGTDDVGVRLARQGLERVGVAVTTALSGGASDANALNAAGVACVNLANGMVDIHTSSERIAVDDLERMVDVTLGIVEAASGVVDGLSLR